MIEKRVTERMLEDGRLSLSHNEVAEADLPEHSGSVELEFAGEVITAQWNSSGRYLHGDAFAERLQEYCRVGGLVRVSSVGATWRIQPVVAASTSLTSPRWLPPPAAAPPVKRPVKKSRRRERPARAFRTDKEFDWTADGKVGFLKASRSSLTAAIRDGGFDSQVMVHLRMEGEQLSTISGYDELYAVDVANVDHMAHQEAVARQVLGKMRGRAVLADEVGLGKTIEAGLVVKELEVRGVAKRVLIICPATLREQWKHEMDEKFEMAFDVALSGVDLRGQDRLIVSLPLATRNPAAVTQEPWDVVIVDEAHRAAGANATKTRETVDRITRTARHVLLLTATPVQNDLLELYRLVEILRPGTLGNVRTFKSNFVDTRDPRRPVNPADLRRLVSSAMIRTTRAQAGVDRVKRRPIDLPVRLGKPERELYLLATDLLRSVMTQKSDAMRRRLLAQRLAGSPYSMGTTALRMANAHPDTRAAKVLEQLAHHALDIKKSAREDAALKLTKQWLDAHGRVLMFTQHTDTVQALLRRLEDEGIDVVPFHGGLSAGQRTEAIGAFRSGKARVLLSTDAGAEGQNLQFCNCVINYDLPWNPMRIEQRIGRVDRLTQPRDEVFVANLFAQDTIDEHVYRLLHDKLRMFELLFGQVTTILGELDGSKDLTFEGRVMEALFSESDSRMSKILDELGTDLEMARQRGQQMAAADQGLSAWLVAAKDHRTGLTHRGADELLPDQVQSRSTRQDLVQSWARRLIPELGGHIVHDSQDEQIGFVSAEFPEDLSDDLGGRTRLHLAFNRGGLAEHPESELCTAGSPTFTDLLDLLRERGDLHFAITDPDGVKDPKPHPHDEAIERVSFEFVPDLQFSGTATFRAEVGDTELSEQIVTAEIKAPRAEKSRKRSLRDAEQLHSSIEPNEQIIRPFEQAAVDKIGKILTEHEAALLEAVNQERQRILDRYDADMPRDLARSLVQELERLSRPPKVRARMELLALDVTQHGLLIQETWRHLGSGSLMTTTRRSGKPIAVGTIDLKTLSMCSTGHAVESSLRRRCTACGEDSCPDCGKLAVFKPCPVCLVEACGRCRKAGDGLCPACAKPTRVPSADEQFGVAWQIGDGSLLVVGSSWAELRRPAGTVTLVKGDGAFDESRVAARNVAVARGLPPDSGLRVSTRAVVETADRGEEVVLRKRTFEIEWGEEPSGGSAVDLAGWEPQHEIAQVQVETEDSVGATTLLARLRQDVPPPLPPSVTVLRVEVVEEFGFDPEGVFRRVVSTDATGQTKILSAESAGWVSTVELEAQETGVVAAALLDRIQAKILRVNDTFRIDCSHPGGSVSFFGSDSMTDFAVASAWQRRLEAAGLPGGRLAIVDRRPVEPTELLQPDSPKLVARNLDEWWEVLPIGEVQAARELQPQDLALIGLDSVDLAPDMRALDRPLREKLATAAACGASHALVPMVSSAETWEDHGTVELSYEVRAGQSPQVILDDDGASSTDFRICSHDHLHRPGTEAHCDRCEDWLCHACDPTGPVHPCTCGRSVCLGCRAASHAFTPRSCVSCGVVDCVHCGAQVVQTSCSVCCRDVCGACADGGRCPPCRNLTTASAEQIRALPDTLVATGAAVMIGRHGATSVVVLRTSDRDELAVIEDGVVTVWDSFVSTDDDDRARFRLGMSRRLGAAAVVEPAVDASWTAPHDHLELHSTISRVCAIRSDRAAWEVIARGIGDPAEGSLRIANTALHFDRVRVPRRTSEGRDQHWPDVNVDYEVRVEFGLMDEARTVSLAPEGLVRIRRLADEVETVVAEWQIVEPRTNAPGHDWDPPATVLAAASLASFEARVVRHGSSTALGVTVRGHIDWYGLHPSPFSAESALLERLLSSPQPIGAVGVWTDREQIVGPNVLSATQVDRVVTPTLHTTTGGSAALLRKCRETWLPGVEARSPQLATLPAQLLTPLRRRFQPVVGVTASIGAHVQDRWLTPDGRSVEVEFDLYPGQHVGYITDAVTRHTLTEACLDHEGHLVASTASCEYCSTTSCGVCRNQVTDCPCCGIRLCGNCTVPNSPGLCGACGSLRQPSRLELARMGRLNRSKVLVGEDRLHSVTAANYGRWTISSTRNGVRTERKMLDDSMTPVLDRMRDRPIGPE